MSPPAPDEFYIGYEHSMPAGIARTVRRAIIGAALCVTAAAALAAALQRPLPAAVFEYTQERTLVGWLTTDPVPTLTVVDAAGTPSVYWLVGQGKFGAHTAGHSDGWVKVTGKRIAREHWQMLEIGARAIAPVRSPAAPPAVPSAVTREVRGRGEIVDSKCFLGVMNPGEKAAHRDCAVRCLSGGVPAFFAFRDDGGSLRLALLLLPGGARPDTAWTRLAGTAVELEGTLVSRGNVDVFAVSTQ